MKVIDACLRSKTKRFWSKEELMDAMLERKDIKVGARSFENDLNLMRHCTQLAYHAPIAYDKSLNGYYYTDSNYSIDKLPLNSSDLAALEIAAATLRQYRHVEVMSGYAAAVDKVIGLVTNLRWDEENDNRKIIDFEKAPYVKGIELFDQLVEAIQGRKVVRLSYQKFVDREPQMRVISPHLLKEYRNRWYLLAVPHEEEKPKIYGLDRVEGLQFLTECNYRDPKDFDSEIYFQNTIGISFHDGKIEEVVLSFTPHDGNYVRTKHLHRTQQVLVDNEDEFRIKLQVVVNYELVSTILGFGTGVVVLKPESLKLRITEELDKALRKYK